MKFEVVLISLVALILGSVLLLIGLGLTLSTYFFSEQVALFFEKLPPYTFLIGLWMMGWAGVILVLGVLISRKKYFHVKMGGYSIADTALRKLLLHALQPMFPDQKIHCDVSIQHGKKITIYVDIPSLNLDQVTSCLYEMEERFMQALSKECGICQPFTVQVKTLPIVPVSVQCRV